MNRHQTSTIVVIISFSIWVLLTIVAFGSVVIVEPLLRERVSESVLEMLPFGIQSSPWMWLWGGLATVGQLICCLVAFCLLERFCGDSRNIRRGGVFDFLDTLRIRKQWLIGFSVLITAAFTIWFFGLIGRVVP